MIQRIYLDHNATTPLHPRVRQKWGEALDLWGNPSSVHWFGRKSKEVLRETRRKLAHILGVSPLEIIFNSGASEGNSAIFAMAKSHPKRRRILLSAVEHSSVQKAADDCAAHGCEVLRIPVSREGQLDFAFLRKHLDESVSLVSVMAAHNETGVIFPVPEVAQMAKACGAQMHCDSVQLLGKVAIDPQFFAQVDYATFSAHKFYALKGAGFLFVRKGSPFHTQVFGTQERFRRGGTENLVGIWSMGEMADEILGSTHSNDLQALRDHLEGEILTKIPDVQITSRGARRLPNTTNWVVAGVDGESLLMALDLEGVAVSTGAACASGSTEPSPGLLAMGLSPSEAQSSLRVSLGWQNTESEIDQFVQIFRKVVHRMRQARELHP